MANIQSPWFFVTNRIWSTTSVVVVFLLCWGSILWAGSDTGADFLRIPIGSRASALSEAYTAVAEGAESLNWNPAGMVSPMGSLSLTHENILEENNLNALAISYPLNNFSLGFNVVHVGYPDQTARGLDRAQTGTLHSSDISIGTGVGIQLGNFRLGSLFKIINQQLSNQSANGYAVDLGILSVVPHSPLSVGASIRNWGPAMRFVEDSFQLPLTLSLGSVYRFTAPFSISMDLRNYPYQKTTSLSLGSEFLVGQNVALRAGYLSKLIRGIQNNQQSETNRGNIAGLSDLSAGLGVKLSNFTLDYALSPFGELGNTHAFTLSTPFGGATPALTDGQNPSNDRSIIIFDEKETSASWWKNK